MDTDVHPGDAALSGEDRDAEEDPEPRGSHSRPAGEAAELAQLRRRAYGPAADIASDPGALARLRELERHVQAAAPVAARTAAGPWHDPPSAAAWRPPDPAPAAAVSEAPPEANVGSADTGDSAVSAGEGGPGRSPLVAPRRLVGTQEPASRRLGGRVRAAWAVSLVLAVALAAGLTLWLFPFGARDDAQHVARLTQQPGGRSSALPIGRDATVEHAYFGEYLGVEVCATEECIYGVFRTAEDQDRDGVGSYSFGGCAGEGIPATMDVLVPDSGEESPFGPDIDVPPQLTRAYPDGAHLRFTREESAIVVDVGAYPESYR